jgi:hypothetical protein
MSVAGALDNHQRIGLGGKGAGGVNSKASQDARQFARVRRQYQRIRAVLAATLADCRLLRRRPVRLVCATRIAVGQDGYRWHYLR